MPPVPVTVAVTRDYDRTAAIAAGEFTAGGRPIELHVEQLERVFAGMGRDQLWDAAEMSLSFYLSMVAEHGDRCPIVALPVFLSRMFRYGYVYVADGPSAPADPRELGGAKIGVPEFGSTMSLWVRGILSDEHGVDWSGSEWIPARDPLVVDSTTGDRSTVMPVAEQFAALARGELGAVFGSLDRRMTATSIGVRRLFPDYHSCDQEYFRKTGIFPIMHVVAVRRELVDREPEVVRDLFYAFAAAKDRALGRLAAAGPLPVTVPFLTQCLEEQTALMGPDPWPYGLEANRATIEASLRYSHAQGLSPRPLTVAEAFPPVWS